MRIRGPLPARPLTATLTASLLLGLTAAASTLAPSASAAPAPVTVWLAGDSTVANASPNGAVGWGQSFASNFNNVTVQNDSIGGRSIQTWLYDGSVTTAKNGAGECRLSSDTYNNRWTSQLNRMRAGDYLMVQFGINDGDSNCPRHVGAARYRELLGVMATAAKSRGVNAVFLTPPAYIGCSGSTAIGNRGFLSDTRNAASANGVPLIDLNAISVKLYNDLRLCPNNGNYSQGRVGDFFANDHTHFSAAGAAQIAAAIADDVRRQGLPLAQWLRSNPTTPTVTTPPPSTPQPTTPEPTTPEPSTPNPSTPNPSTPEPSTPNPTTAPPWTPEPSTPSSPPPGGNACSATFTVTNSWSSGFQGAVTIGRTSSATRSWATTFTLGAGQTLRQVWGGIVSTAGNSVTVRSENWNGNLATASASFGLIVDGPASVSAVSCQTT